MVPAQDIFVKTRLQKLKLLYNDLRSLLLGYAAGIEMAFPPSHHQQGKEMRSVQYY